MHNSISKENVILLTGSEDYFIKKKVSEFTTLVSIPEMNLTIYNEIDDSQIVNACQQVPFGDDKSVIIIYGDLFKKEHPSLAKYISNPNKQCLLVIVTPLDKRKSFYKSLEKTVTILNYNKLDKKKFYEFTSNYFITRGKCLNDATVDAAVKRTKYLETDDSSIFEVVTEYDRVIALAGNNEITIKDIQTIKPLLDLNVFKFINLLGRRNYINALSFLHVLTGNNVNEFQVLSLLVRHYRILLKLKISSPEKVGITSFMMNEFQDFKYFCEEDILKSIDLINDTQNNIKTGFISGKTALEELIVRLSLIGGEL